MVDLPDDAALPLSATGPLQKFEVPMTRSSSKARGNPNWERTRRNGQFVSGPDKETEPYAARHTTNYRRLRNAAMRLLKHLEHMMPEPEKDQPAEPADIEPTEIVPAATEIAEPGQGAAQKKGKALDEAYERLLGRSDGIINGFNTLALLVVRLIDKERESRASAKKRPPASHPQIDETELDRQILEELDLIAQARRGEEDLQKAS
jgi:hypothetical protein